MVDGQDGRARTLRLLFGGRPSLWGLLVPVVMVLAGLLFATSAVTAKGAALRPSETSNLADVVTSRGQMLQGKEQRVARLREEVKGLTARTAPDGSRAEGLQAAAARLSQPAGAQPVRGTALQVTMTDSQRSVDSFNGEFSADDLVIHQQDVQAVVNALWRGGAEAMMIQDQRVISTSAVRCVGNTLILQNRVYSPPFTIKAIGDPARLRSALDEEEAVRIIQEYVTAVGLGYDVREVGVQTFPAYDGSVTLHHATVTK